jgi:uncharacterized membrane protein YdjX (TVP38/TMEM64 family)
MFFVMSFPPVSYVRFFMLNCLVDGNLRSQLFGHEILAILCGLVWGAKVGFAITAAGTFIGEVANF